MQGSQLSFQHFSKLGVGKKEPLNYHNSREYWLGLKCNDCTDGHVIEEHKTAAVAKNGMNPSVKEYWMNKMPVSDAEVDITICNSIMSSDAVELNSAWFRYPTGFSNKALAYTFPE